MSWIEVIYEFVAAQLLGCGTMRLTRTNNTSSRMPIRRGSRLFWICGGSVDHPKRECLKICLEWGFAHVAARLKEQLKQCAFLPEIFPSLPHCSGKHLQIILNAIPTLPFLFIICDNNRVNREP